MNSSSGTLWLFGQPMRCGSVRNCSSVSSSCTRRVVRRRDAHPLHGAHVHHAQPVREGARAEHAAACSCRGRDRRRRIRDGRGWSRRSARCGIERPALRAITRRSAAGITRRCASAEQMTVKLRWTIAGSNVGCVPRVIWIRSSASRTGSTSDRPRGVSSMSRPDAHQQRVVEVVPQLLQGGAHRRLRHEHPLRRPRHVFLVNQRIQRDQQIQVEAVELHVVSLIRLTVTGRRIARIRGTLQLPPVPAMGRLRGDIRHERRPVYAAWATRSPTYICDE